MFTKEQQDLIKKSGVFDASWYAKTYPDVPDMGLEPFEHFLRFGYRMGRQPSPHFNAKAYAIEYPTLVREGKNLLIHFIESGAAAKAVSDAKARASALRFSVITPTKDRESTIVAAVDSLLAQPIQDFEHIIVDDGSTDGTEALVRQKYAAQIKAGKIVYLKCPSSNGVCVARNIGLAKAKGEWIAYLDSDNTVRPNFLEAAAKAIAQNPSASTLYGNFRVKETGQTGGKPFDLAELYRRNFIDLGVFFHRRECYNHLGGFDANLRRLVDWDLILRYTTEYPPVYIRQVLMDYSNPESDTRISRSEYYARAQVQVHRKHRVKDTVSIVIPCYNQEEYIEHALRSVLAQKGDFSYEILISDDGSTDKTPEIIERLCRENRNHVRSIGSPHNQGISENFKRCFREAAGEYLAVLEGDDFWEDERNLETKLKFMREHPDCSMVFSKIKMLVMRGGKTEEKFLPRQQKLKKNKLTGQDFIDDPDMNLVANFSSCLFRTDLLKSMPHQIYGHRLSEISVAFYMENFGPIGFIDKPMTAYRNHESGTWSGMSDREKLLSGIKVRKVVKSVASERYKPAIEKIIQERYEAPLKKLEAA